MGTPPEPRRGTEEPLRSSRRIRPHDRRLPRRAAAGRRSFASTLAALDELAESGAKVAVRVTDLDRGDAVLSGDDFITLPIGGLGVVPLLVEVAAAFDDGRLDPAEVVDRTSTDGVSVAGLWHHLAAQTFSLGDLAVLAASAGDPRPGPSGPGQRAGRGVKILAERGGLPPDLPTTSQACDKHVNPLR